MQNVSILMYWVCVVRSNAPLLDAYTECNNSRGQFHLA